VEVTTMAQSQTIAHYQEPRPLIGGRLGPLRGEWRDTRYQAFLLLWIAFVVAPLLFGIDKFFTWMTYWPDFGLLLAALALARLGAAYAPHPFRRILRRAAVDGAAADTGRARQPYAA
jgi:hypothetical protein